MMTYYDLLWYARTYSGVGGKKEKHFDKVSVPFDHLREYKGL